ncbi:hypothetical protein GUITHDRAFT_81139 [Guillardia theta CCMP2712]|uniref:F5/8 type C domain-containing protein n=1 Tax=Guillardia theta (strain CCMP2712) TaxID=905079 RepID=L1IC29_GUITC|nr:hypothetical protein GUITHDRAFT_81139 [Guillardia theta CCMP2712]EKX33786.1 hypothetical protein GUITHDRAFT_81139 [Guillardia theta CCMP2712]|eukprot:XP_005820766.1 hypothetical protein GUITHDRAFT_81139 [Guillardia theta CCMP2712]
MQLDAGDVTSIAGIVTQGRPGQQRVKQFTVKYSIDGETWFDVECGRIFVGNNDADTRVISKFSAPVKAKYVRIFPLDWDNHPSMRAGLLVCDATITAGKPSKWTLRIFKANSAMANMPDVSTLTYVGQVEVCLNCAVRL